MTFIAGPFTATYNAKAIGSTEDGFEIIYNRIQEEIRADMNRGLLDAVHQGIDMMIRAVFIEADFEGLREMIWPFDHDWDGIVPETTAGPPSVLNNTGLHGGVGQLISVLAKPLVLTPCGGTTAKTNGNPANGAALTSITFPKVVLATDAVNLKYASTLRKVPVTLLVLPDKQSPGDITIPMAFPYCNSSLLYYAAA